MTAHTDLDARAAPAQRLVDDAIPDVIACRGPTCRGPVAHGRLARPAAGCHHGRPVTLPVS
jgi:hypothetical protein